jgi:preprotein translocase subunit SecA
MTATAQSAAEEFKEFYGLHTVAIPPNRPCIRTDHSDRIFTSKTEKLTSLINEIECVHATGRPILVGTRSVRESSDIATALRNRGIGCAVLNAKRDAYEAAIIAEAGTIGAVTISTNMAGRGTDIKLGGSDEHSRERVIASGGLYVIGTNRHESVRIDNQLRGRAGRQGEPGSSRFFISLEDDLFVQYRLKELLPTRFIWDKRRGCIDNPGVRSEIERIQRIIEGQHFEIKKTLWNYSFLLEKQRQILSSIRQQYLDKNYTASFFQRHCSEHYAVVRKSATTKEIAFASRICALGAIDTLWSEYLSEITDIRESIHLRRLGGQDPLFEFRKISIDLFDSLHERIKHRMREYFTQLSVSDGKMNISTVSAKIPSSTWTYLINDNPFENMIELQFIGNVGVSAGALLTWPLLLLYPLVRRWRKKREQR